MRPASMIVRFAALVVTLLTTLACLAQTQLPPANLRGGNSAIPSLDGGVYAYAPSIMADGAVYKVWFCSPDYNPFGDHIFYSESSNLDSGWSTPVSVFGGTGTADVGGNPNNSDFDRTHTCDPSVIRVDGVYYMYYGGNWSPGPTSSTPHDPSGGRTAIGVASSPDGKTWTRMNGGRPIITPKNAVDGYYGAGQPSVFYHRGLFYMLYTDTSTQLPSAEANNAFVLRSPDPTFQSGVQELQYYGTWVSLAAGAPPARTWTLFGGMASLDWRYEDALGGFGVVIPTGALDTIAVLWYDIDTSVHTYRIDFPGNWTEGAGLVHRPDGHAPPPAAGTLNQVPVDVMRPVGTPGSPGTYRLAHRGVDYSTSKNNPTVSVSSSIANMAPAGVAVTFTATTQADATGTVTFYDGGTVLGTGVLSSGVASFSTSTLSAGDHSIAAFYSGDGVYSSASSPSIWQAIVQTGRVVNMSARANTQTGTTGVLIGGLTIGGTSAKTVAITAAGPSLLPYGVTNALPDPKITLVRSSDQAILDSNDDWQSHPNAAQLQAAGYAPSHAKEPGMLVTLAPGAYTAYVEGVGSPNGVTVLGAYEAGQPQSPFINLSARAWVGTGSDVAITGFVIQDQPRTVVITAAGPSLTPYGIPNALANPKLTLIRSSDQAVLATNDDWKKGLKASQILALGFAPSHALESAIISTLPPGAYTVILEGINGGTGIGLMGMYAMPQGY